MQRSLLLALLVVSAPAFAGDVDPNGFEKQHAQSSMTRAEAVAQMRAPVALGIKIDDQGRVVTTPSTKPRAQVVAETQEAARLGLLRGGELAPIQPTIEQEQRIRQAGLEALRQSVEVE